jgi:hypothetical protein
MLTKGVVLLHDNPRLNKCSNQGLQLGDFDYSPYSTDLAPSHYHLFTKMKVWLATQRFHTNEELTDEVNKWLHYLAAPLFDEGLQNLVSRYDQCLNVDDNYLER